MAAPEGYCHICGIFGKLSFEHVPPEGAFNDQPVRLMGIEDGLHGDPMPKGTQQQRGMGAYTLCASCNNLTGHWYGYHFAQFCHQAAYLLLRSNGKPTLYYPYYISPLSVIKQIVCMFFSVKDLDFAKEHPDLVRFVLNRDAYYLDPKYTFGIYYQTGQRVRGLGTAGKIDVDMDTMEPVGMSVFSEIAYFPLGYVMMIDSPPPDKRLIDISHFARFLYGQYAVAQLRLPVLPVETFIPGDFGSFAAEKGP